MFLFVDNEIKLTDIKNTCWNKGLQFLFFDGPVILKCSTQTNIYFLSGTVSFRRNVKWSRKSLRKVITYSTFYILKKHIIFIFSLVCSSKILLSHTKPKFLLKILEKNFIIFLRLWSIVSSHGLIISIYVLKMQ